MDSVDWGSVVVVSLRCHVVDSYQVDEVKFR